MSESRYSEGVLRYFADDLARTVTTYTAAGVVKSTRPYTTAENATADEYAAQAAAESARLTIEQALSDALVTLQTILDTTNATINASPAAYVKDLARVQRRMIRLQLRRFDGTT